MDSDVTPGVQTESGADAKEGIGPAAVATFAVALGVVAVISSWTGWGGIAVGVVTAACAAYVLVKRGAGMKRGVVALVLAVVAVVLGVLVLEGFTSDSDADFGRGLTLDQCMAQAPIAKLQHLCKSQHLEEFQQRYPNAEQ